MACHRCRKARGGQHCAPLTVPAKMQGSLGGSWLPHEKQTCPDRQDTLSQVRPGELDLVVVVLAFLPLKLSYPRLKLSYPVPLA
jgi:hypothetical protein